MAGRRIAGFIEAQEAEEQIESSQTWFAVSPRCFAWKTEKEKNVWCDNCSEPQARWDECGWSKERQDWSFVRRRRLQLVCGREGGMAAELVSGHPATSEDLLSPHFERPGIGAICSLTICWACALATRASLAYAVSRR